MCQGGVPILLGIEWRTRSLGLVNVAKEDVWAVIRPPRLCCLHPGSRRLSMSQVLVGTSQNGLDSTTSGRRISLCNPKESPDEQHFLRRYDV